MRRFLIFITGIIILLSVSCNTSEKKQYSERTITTNPLPSVLPENRSDLIKSKFRQEAAMRFSVLQLPDNLNDWEKFRVQLKEEVLKKTGAVIQHDLPLNIKETRSQKMQCYTIKNIAFQVRPGVYATSNLFIPDGTGPFPAVIMMCGHNLNARLHERSQALGHSLALNDYVCLTIDPWGAGERTTEYGKFEYHGASLGASLLDIGESLMGAHISDNMRGVDLLVSLPYVDPKNIGATGASGGGNQTMWLAAMDERIKAAIPVVSVGTFESYVMGHNCICETLPDGLCFTEESGILALIAPRALNLFNAKLDSNPTFYPSEMLRSFNNAKPVFQLYEAENNIKYELFDLPHGYHKEMRPYMLGWFDLHLKGIGTGEPKEEIPFKTLPEEDLMLFPGRQRDSDILSTEAYCKKTGGELKDKFLQIKSFNCTQKKQELLDVLRIDNNPEIKKVHYFSNKGGWERIALETSDNKLIPILLLPSAGINAEYTIICNSAGKGSISPDLTEEIKNTGSGIVIVDLSGTGEAYSSESVSYDKIAVLHTLSRAALWTGKTVLGEWVKELKLVTQLLQDTYKAKIINIDGTKEAGLAGLFLGATSGILKNITLRDAPVSYVFDNRENIDFFSMGIHIPGILKWGDIALATALTGQNITFINPVSMSGSKLSQEELKNIQSEFENVRKICGQKGSTSFSF